MGDTFENFFFRPFSISVRAITGQNATIRITYHGLNPVWMVQGRIDGAGMHWSRGSDAFAAADVDGDTHEEIVVVNNQNGYIGVLKWDGSALVPVWIAATH